jgi:teichuronic acid biosynthesis glycosyltransferase TuaG
MSGSSPQVSIIMPLYNSEEYLRDSISSVISQTFTSWELIIVDDCSTDKSFDIAQEFARKDLRIKVYQTETCSGSPTKPRNTAIEKAAGKFIAFLDSDDIWLPAKLSEQIPFFEDPDTYVVFSDYKKLFGQRKISKRAVKAPFHVNYRELLKGNAIGNLTAVYDTSKTGKKFFIDTPHEDYAYWLSILREGGTATNTAQVHALYRIHEGSISGNKLKVLTWDWHIYRDLEHLGFLRTIYCYIHYIIRGIRKYAIR